MADHKPSQISPPSPTESQMAISKAIFDMESQQENPHDDIQVIDYTKRAQWLRDAVLGAIEGLLSTAFLLMGVEDVRKRVKTMLLIAVAELVAGAFRRAIKEFMSVSSQNDVEVAQLKREGKPVKEAELRNPFYAAVVSAVAFAVGLVVPLGVVFIEDHKVRLGVVVGVVSLALLVVGALSGVLGKVPVVKSSLRALFGGLLIMAISFIQTKYVDPIGHE